MKHLLWNIAWAWLVSTLSASWTLAECPTIDFENLAVNTAVTTQYDGVTFSVQPQTCGNSPTLYMRIATQPNGTSSGTKCIRIDGGCPDFSDDYLRMVFDVAHGEVSFTLGDWATTYTVRYYSTTSGAGLIGSLNVVIPPAGGGDIGVHRRVKVTSASNNIRRIEVQGATSTFEAIDDLFFEIDSTPPAAQITSPAPLACTCNARSIIGSAFDEDGDIENFRLERKAPDAGIWTLIRMSSTEVIDDELSAWTTAAPQGYYLLRLTTTNLCDMTAAATTVVWLDKAFDSLALRSPTAGSIIGGTVCLDGTAWDHCGGNFTLESRPLGGLFHSVDVVNTPWIINDPLGSWNTRAGISDGDYELRLAGTDDCGNTASALRAVTVDNTAPTVLITAPRTCGCVNGLVELYGTVSDAHLAGWEVQYSGGDAHGWVPIPGASGTEAVNDGYLGTWDTTGLDPCSYALRLVASDRSVVDCIRPNQNEYQVSLSVGTCEVGDYDFDTDNDGDVDLVDYAAFEEAFTGP